MVKFSYTAGLILVASLPLPAFAIPSPDLLSSLFQSILSSLGIILASIVLVFYTLLRNWRVLVSKCSTKTIILTMVAILLILLVIFIVQIVNYYEKKNSLTAELASIWLEHDANYDAPVEFDYNQHLRELPGVMGWEKFLSLSNETKLVLDIRDPSAYAIDHIEGSTNIRFTDLILGQWESIADYMDHPIYVLCYTGTTGALASEFLREKGFTAVYRPDGGLMGSIKNLPLEQLYLPRSQTRTIHTTEAKLRRLDPSLLTDSVVIDVRLNPNQKNPQFPKAKRFLYPHKSTAEIEAFVADVNTERSIIIVCDSEVSCFSADVLTLEMRAAGKNIAHILSYE